MRVDNWHRVSTCNRMQQSICTRNATDGSLRLFLMTDRIAGQQLCLFVFAQQLLYATVTMPYKAQCRNARLNKQSKQEVQNTSSSAKSSLTEPPRPKNVQ